jgi:hypothetical protein
MGPLCRLHMKYNDGYHEIGRCFKISFRPIVALCNVRSTKFINDGDMNFHECFTTCRRLSVPEFRISHTSLQPLPALVVFVINGSYSGSLLYGSFTKYLTTIRRLTGGSTRHRIFLFIRYENHACQPQRTA